MRFLGLEIEDAEAGDGGLLLQPCRALKGKQCSIYPHRPDCCRTFECRLLQEVKRGTVGVDRAKVKIAEALQLIERLNELIGQVGSGNEQQPLKERCMEALLHFEEAGTDPELSRKRTELQAAMTTVERLIQETFLGG